MSEYGSAKSFSSVSESMSSSYSSSASSSSGSEDPAPCFCPEGLADCYLIDLAGGEGEVVPPNWGSRLRWSAQQIQLTRDPDRDCTWRGNVEVEALVFGDWWGLTGFIELFLHQCRWTFGISIGDGYVEPYPDGTSKAVGATPVGVYPDGSVVLECDP